MNQNRLSNYIILTTLLGIVVFFIYSVSVKQNTLKSGELVLLELAPVDPRSLMQGDYMTLDYKVAQDLNRIQYQIMRFSEEVQEQLTNVDSPLNNDSIRHAHFEGANQNDLDYKDYPVKGYMELVLNDQGVGEFVGLHKEFVQVDAGHILVKYFNKDSWSIDLGASSFFFEEGKAEAFEMAKYGALKVDQKGNSILVGLYDQNLELIE